MQRKKKKKEGCWFCRERRDKKKGGFIGSEILARIYFHGSLSSSEELYFCPVCGRSTDSPPLSFEEKIKKTIKKLEREKKIITRIIVRNFTITKNWLSQNFLNSLREKGVKIEVI